MPTGIYITSLRKSTTKESVEKYAVLQKELQHLFENLTNVNLISKETQAIHHR